MIVDKLVEKAMKRAQGAQASLIRSESADVSFEDDKLKSSRSSQSTRLSLKVIVDGRLGSSYSTDIDDVDGVVERALQVAEFGNTCHFEFPAPQEYPDVKTYDETVVAFSQEEMVSIGKSMISQVKEYNPNIILSPGVTRNITTSEFANSNGVKCEDKSTYVSFDIYGTLVRGTDILMAGHGLGWRKRSIDHVLIARKTVDLFRMAEKTVDMVSGDVPVIFMPQGMSVLLLALQRGFHGKNVLLGASPLAGRLGDTIADARLTIVDNPLIDYAASSGKYDDEGVPHQVTPLIENGIARNFLYDLETAGRAGTTSTGNGVGCNTTNLVVKEGDTTYQEMIESTGEGLLVHSVLGLGQGNPISGEFSVNVQLGYRIKNGKIVGRVKDVMLAGNTYDAIMNIDAIGDEAEWAWGSIHTPPIKIRELSVVA